MRERLLEMARLYFSQRILEQDVMGAVEFFGYVDRQRAKVPDADAVIQEGYHEALGWLARHDSLSVAVPSFETLLREIVEGTSWPLSMN